MEIFVVILLFVSAGEAYIAAVVEYTPVINENASQAIQTNLNNYRGFAQKAQTEHVDILVFPENGLTGLVDHPMDYAVDLDEQSTNAFLINLSDIAKTCGLYLVVNLLEKVKGNDSNTTYYNTNVVYDRNGTILTRYRKINLYKEPNITAGNDIVTFTTDFNVTFGVFTCLDIMFYSPAGAILKNPDVTDIVYPTAWFSKMPFYTSLSIQHGYALANGVNLLASNYGDPAQGHGGSGIYTSDGQIGKAYISASQMPNDKPITYEVTHNGRGNRTVCLNVASHDLTPTISVDDLSAYKTDDSFNASSYVFGDVHPQNRTDIEICHNEFCCTFNITVGQPGGPNDFFKMMVFSGPTLQGTSIVNLRICSLLACEYDFSPSCGKRKNTSTKFTKITVTARVWEGPKDIYTPISLTTGLRPINNTNYCDTNPGNGTSTVQFSTTNGTPDGVLVFGIYGIVDSLPHSNIHSTQYVAAVVDYHPVANGKPMQTMTSNLNIYRLFAGKAHEQKVDILVFPEYGLTCLVSDTKSYAIELIPDNEVMRELRSIAVDHLMYLVVNLLEKDNNDTYNTNLVFDRRGNILTKYRKINVQQEVGLTPGNETIKFTTDFGVTFGLLTGSDIMYNRPSKALMDDKDVTDVIFPAALHSEVPFYTSLTIQSGYWLAAGVNLLAAGYVQPNESLGGSGIYLSSGNLAETYISDSPTSIVVTRDVPKVLTKHNRTICPDITYGKLANSTIFNVSNFVVSRIFETSKYTFRSVVATQQFTEICHGMFCCTFNIRVGAPEGFKEIYKLAAFDGIEGTVHVRFCALLACEDDSEGSCGKMMNVDTKFAKLSVKAAVIKDGATVYSPVTLNDNLQSILDVLYCDSNGGMGLADVELSTLLEVEGVLVFGLLGRGDPAVSGCQHTGSVLLVTLTALFYLLHGF